MKIKYLAVIILALWGNGLFAQTDSGITDSRIKEIETAVQTVRKENATLTKQNSRLQGHVAKLQEDVASLTNDLTKASSQLETQTADLKGRITYTQSNIDSGLDSVLERITNRTILIAIFILLTALLAIVLFMLIKRQLSKNTETIDVIKDAQKKIEEKSVKLDTKLIELLESQYKAQSVATSIQSVEGDHSLVKKIADEIVRLETNLSKMDKDIKGYNQLKKAVERIKDNFMSNGYEIVDMLGKPYNDGMKVIASFVSDESLTNEEQIITGIIKPQINYKGVMIQSAQIQVSQGE